MTVFAQEDVALVFFKFGFNYDATNPEVYSNGDPEQGPNSDYKVSVHARATSKSVLGNSQGMSSSRRVIL